MNGRNIYIEKLTLNEYGFDENE